MPGVARFEHPLRVSSPCAELSETKTQPCRLKMVLNGDLFGFRILSKKKLYPRFHVVVILEIVAQSGCCLISFPPLSRPGQAGFAGRDMQDGHPIAFESRKLNDTERRYTVQEKEMSATVHCLRTWRHYLLGSAFVVKTDNVATSYFQTQKKLSPKQARWQDFLAEFDYVLEYKLGRGNVVANGLSRKASLVALSNPESSLMGRIREGKQLDLQVKKLLEFAQ